MNQLFNFLMSVYFGGFVIYVATWILKPTVFMTEEAFERCVAKTKSECIGPKTFAFAMTLVTFVSASIWMIIVFYRIRDGRSTLQDVKDSEK